VSIDCRTKQVAHANMGKACKFIDQSLFCQNAHAKLLGLGRPSNFQDTCWASEWHVVLGVDVCLGLTEELQGTVPRDVLEAWCFIQNLVCSLFGTRPQMS